MVDVTKSNFDCVHDRIKQLLPSCSFVSIDLEFSGLRDHSHAKNRYLSRYDLPSQRYMKQREFIQNFLMLQFGVCLWKYDSSTATVTAYPFNFWTFPDNHANDTFLCQASSLVFLRENGFDFNKLIDGGISFLSIDQEKRERRNYHETEQKKQERIKERKQSKTRVQPKSERDVQFMQELEQKLKQFAEDESNEETVLELGFLNGFRRLLVHQLIDHEFADKLIAIKMNDGEDSHNNNKRIKKVGVKKVTESSSKQKLQEEQDRKAIHEWNENVNKSIGVRKIFDLIAANRVPVLLHNGLLDSMHVYRSFISNLPNDPCLFTQRLHNHLPFVFDTKYMMKQLFADSGVQDNFSLARCFEFFMNAKTEKEQVQSTNAMDANGEMVNSGNTNDRPDEKEEDEDADIDVALNEDVNAQTIGVADINGILKIDCCIQLSEDGDRNSEKEQSYLNDLTGPFHEAGYDAYCTGYVFAKMGAYLHLLRQSENQNETIVTNERQNGLSDLFHAKDEFHQSEIDKMTSLGHFVNRLNLSSNYNKHFYVGNRYTIHDAFNLNLKMNEYFSSGEEAESPKQPNVAKGTLCGVDYNAINDEWYYMFQCSLDVNPPTNSETAEVENGNEKQLVADIEQLITAYLKEFITETERICVYKRSFGVAAVRIIDITQQEYDNIVASMEAKEDNRLKFEKYLDHKSEELMEEYKKIYEAVKQRQSRNQMGTPRNENKKRNASHLDSEEDPPNKKQRTD